MAGSQLSGPWPLIPLALLIPLIVWDGRRSRRSNTTILLQVVLCTWVAALVTVTFFPLPLPPYERTPGELADYRGWPYPWISPVPFETIRSSLEQGLSYPAGRFLIGNVGAFLPLGVLAPMLSPRWRSWWRVLVLGLSVSLLVEATQLLLSLGMGVPWRVADVDDVILNTIGMLVGFGAWATARRLVDRWTTGARIGRPRVL